MILIVDNYDSFVFNIARYFEELGEKVSVVRNDSSELATTSPFPRRGKVAKPDGGLSAPSISTLDSAPEPRPPSVLRTPSPYGGRVNVAAANNIKAIVISPGPCTPAEAGQSSAIVQQFSGKLPILGICLGHQVIGEVFGAKVKRAKRPLHGEASDIEHTGQGVFTNLPQNFAAGRYHSLIVDETENTPLKVTARAENGEIMGLQHESHPTFGVQFHPESILTEHGYDLLRNFLRATL